MLNALTLDGARLRYCDTGAGEAVLLLHGYPQSHECWRHQIGPLSARYRVIAPDWFGWGESDRSVALACTYDAEVARIGRVLDALDLPVVNLFAHDYGGFLGLGFVIRQPTRVRRLAILNSRAHRTFPWPHYQRFALISLLGRTPGLRRLAAGAPLGDLHRRALRRHVRQGCFDRHQMERYVGWMDTAQGRRWLMHFFADYSVRPRVELAEGLAAIRCPVAVIWGDRDPYCPYSIAEDLAYRMPAARLHRLAGADHYVMEERPREVLGALESLLQS